MSSPDLSSFTPIPNLLAGGAFTINDMIESGPTGYGYGKDHQQITDYAAIGNAANVIAQTAISPGFGAPAPLRYTPLQAADGSIFMTCQNSGTNCLVINKYTALGAAAAVNSTLVVDSTNTTQTSARMFFLSNKNIGVVWRHGGTDIYFAIITQNLLVVVAKTLIETGGNGGFSDAIPLVLGGFAVTWVGATTTQVRYATYSNAGAAVVAAKTIQTWGAVSLTSGVPGPFPVACTRLAQLSNGNVTALAVSGVSTSSSGGAWLSIWDLTGTQVLAPTLKLGANNVQVNYAPALLPITGFCGIICNQNSRLTTMAVVDNTGAIQGSVFTGTDTQTQSQGWGPSNIVFDGTYFWAPYGDTAGTSQLSFVQMTTAGVATTFSTVVGAPVGISNIGGLPMSAIFDRGYIVVILGQPQSAAKNQFCAVRLGNDAGTIIPRQFVAWTEFGTTPGTDGSGHAGIISGGDFTFIVQYDYDNAGAALAYFIAQKWADSAVVGVAMNSGVMGDPILLKQPDATYGANQMGGSNYVALDFTATHILGVKGTLTNHSLTVTQAP